MDQRIHSEVYVKVLNEPMKILLNVVRKWETARDKEKKSLISAGIEPMSRSGSPLLYRLSYETRRDQVMGDYGSNCGKCECKWYK